jgi:tetratricopeptide (TPR) repeat protein
LEKVMRASVCRRMPLVRCLIACALVVVLPACATGPSTDGAVGDATGGAVIGPSLDSADTVAGNYLAGWFAQQHHDTPVASEYLSKALAEDPDNVELLQRTYLALATDGQLDKAAGLAKRLLAYDEEAAVAAILVAERAAKAGDWRAVKTAVSSLPKRGLNTFMTPLIVAWAKMGGGRVDEALEALAPLGQDKGYATLKAFHAALINDLADRRQVAEQEYRVVLASSGGLTLRTVEAVGAFYHRTGQLQKEAEVLARYQHEHPDSVVLDRPGSSRRPVDSATAGLAEVMFGTAGSLRQGNAPDLALLFGRLALDLRPDFPLAQVMVADLLEGLGQVGTATQLLKDINLDSPIHFAAQLRVAANLDDANDVDGAVQTLQALAARYPHRPDALVSLGDVLRRHKRWSDAILAYDRAIAAFDKPERDQWGVYYARGVALERDHQWARAEGDFLHALSLEPDEPHVLNYLGYSWVEQGTNLDQARKMIEKAAKARPTDGYIVDSLGWALFRVGEYGKAVEALERAVELHPEDATINDHLGDALWQVGRRDEARFQWKRALVFGPEPELKTEIERKLDSGPHPGAVVGGKNAAAR